MNLAAAYNSQKNIRIFHASREGQRKRPGRQVDPQKRLAVYWLLCVGVRPAEVARITGLSSSVVGRMRMSLRGIL